MRRILVMLVVAACGPGVGEPSSSVSASETGSTGGSSSSGAEETRPDPSQSDADAGGEATSSGAAATSTGEVCRPCFFDFPCNGSEDRCVDDWTIERYATVPCEEISDPNCDPECCMGSSCLPAFEEPCPEDGSCVATDDGARCLPADQACGPAGMDCGADQFCEYATGLCPEAPGPLGQCIPAPPDPCPDPTPGEAQCGCDGNTYESACLRQTAGIPLASSGPC